MFTEPYGTAAVEGLGSTQRGRNGCSPPRFHLEVERGPSCVWVTLRGEVDLEIAGLVDDALRVLQAVGCGDLVLDLRRMSFVDYAALRVLFAARPRARETETRLEVLCDPRQLVERLLALDGTGQSIGIDAQSRMTGAAAHRIDEEVAA